MKNKKMLWLFIVAIMSSCSSQTENKFFTSKKEKKQMNESKKVLFVLTSHAVKGNTGQPTGFYLSEAAHPWKVLHENGFEVDFVSPKGGKPPVDGLKLDDPVNKAFWENEDIAIKLQNTLTPEKVNASDYAAIHYVGGHGTMWDFQHSPEIAKIATSIYEKGGIVSAVCHGPAGLINIKLSDGTYLLDGKTVTAFTNAEEEAVGLTEVVPFLLESMLKERGAKFEKSDNFQEKVVVDGRLITGQNPASAAQVGHHLVNLLMSESVVNR